jgi:hypothetical protein
MSGVCDVGGYVHVSIGGSKHPHGRAAARESDGTGCVPRSAFYTPQGHAFSSCTTQGVVGMCMLANGSRPNGRSLIQDQPAKPLPSRKTQTKQGEWRRRKTVCWHRLKPPMVQRRHPCPRQKVQARAPHAHLWRKSAAMTSRPRRSPLRACAACPALQRFDSNGQHRLRRHPRSIADTSGPLTERPPSRSPATFLAHPTRVSHMRRSVAHNVGSIVANLNRNSTSSDPRTSPPSAGLQRGGRGRPTSVKEKRWSLMGLARRTMDSDAEEAVVG